MVKPASVSAEPSAFREHAVRMVTLGHRGEQMAVHVAGRLASDRTPLLCIPGYNRNMADFAAFVPLLQRLMKSDWPVVLVDLRGRGRSTRRRRADDYTTLNDARDLSMLCRALGLETAVVLGQGHGGQVAMALALERPAVIAGAILVDAGPVTAPESLIRLRNNIGAIAGLKGAGGLTVMLRRMLAADYPGLDGAELDRLAARTHVIEPSGRAGPLFDPALIARLKDFSHEDVLTPQWPFFDLLREVPLMLLRTELTDQLPRPVLEQMLERRPDALGLAITRQGSPALLDRSDEVSAIAEFIRRIGHPRERTTRRG
ncbi:MAG: alpha/beta hydrolase [Devosia sp.]|nr:alpha/beta hydrolase [Devosia sp.]